MNNRFALGTKVRDIVSGFEGIITSETTHLNMCVRYGVQAKVDKDGKCAGPEWFDIDQLEYVNAGITVQKRTSPPGGDREDPPARNHAA